MAFNVLLRIVAIVLVLGLLISCADNEGNFIVSVSYEPSSPIAGDDVVFKVSVFPKPFAKLDSSIILKVGDHRFVSESDYLEKSVKLREGEYEVKAEFSYNGKVYESDPLNLSVASISEKYRMELEVPKEIRGGTGVEVTVHLYPVPKFEDWKVDIFMDGELRGSLPESDFSDGVGSIRIEVETGKHSVKAVLNSPFGTMESSEVDFEVLDVTPPVIEDVEIFPSTPVAGEEVYFMVRFDDPDGTVKGLSLYVDGKLMEYKVPLGDIGILSALGLDEGFHKVTIVAENESGYSTSVNLNLNILPYDVSPPDVSLVFKKMVFATGENVPVKLIATDDGGLTNYEIILDGETWEEGDLKGEKSYTEEIVFHDLGTGFHLVKVIFRDRAGRSTALTREFYVNDMLILVKLYVDTPSPKSGDMITFYFGLYDTLPSSLEFLRLFIDSEEIYEFSSESSETFSPYVSWKAVAGQHVAKLLVKTVDGKYGMDSVLIGVEDIDPPVIEAFYVNGEEIGDDPSSPVRIEAGAHKVRIFVRDDNKLAEGDYVLLDVYDIDGEEDFLETLVIPQSEISIDMKEATYALNLNFPIGKYKLVVKHLEDAAGNEADEEEFYMLVAF